jgi:hypothetical protein
MKIYTEINYKWLDGQLVKTSSKSFEYEGDLTLCGGGGGGGKGGGGGGSSGISLSVPDLKIGGTGGELLDAGKENLSDATDAGKTNLETGADATKEAMAAVTDAGKTNLETGADAVSAARDEIVKMFIEDPLEEVMDVFPGGDSAGTRVNTFAKGNIGKAQKNNPFLAIEKGKRFARSSTQFRRKPSATSTLS